MSDRARLADLVDRAKVTLQELQDILGAFQSSAFSEADSEVLFHTEHSAAAIGPHLHLDSLSTRPVLLVWSAAWDKL